VAFPGRRDADALQVDLIIGLGVEAGRGIVRTESADQSLEARAGIENQGAAAGAGPASKNNSPLTTGPLATSGVPPSYSVMLPPALPPDGTMTRPPIVSLVAVSPPATISTPPLPMYPPLAVPPLLMMSSPALVSGP